MSKLTQDNTTPLLPPTGIRAYLGGSFDPVHQGHLQMALGVYHTLASIAQQHCRPLQVSLLPNARSPFKDHSSDPKHRLAMLQLACADTPLDICTLELWQTPPVYSIDSVRYLRKQHPHDSLIFIMGADSMATLEHWRDGLSLTDYVHLWVFNRHLETTQSGSDSNPDNDPDTDTNTKSNMTQIIPVALQHQISQSPLALLQPIGPANHTDQSSESRDKGAIYIDDSPIVSISSTQLRHALCRSSQTPIASSSHLLHALPNKVFDYIRQHHLYCESDFVKIND